MTEATRQISPDGAYWWDGQAWRPMPAPASPVLIPKSQPEPESARPSWLPEGTDLPDHSSQSQTTATADIAIPSEPAYTDTAPMQPWMAPQSSGGSRSLIMIAAAAALVLMVGGVGVYALTQSLNRNSAEAPTGNVVATATPSISSTPSTAPPITQPLTGQLGGEYCPVAHPNDSACWKGSFLNTGPALRQLALIFVVGSGYADWFAHHANATLSGFYTTSGCDIDAKNRRIVCGGVAPRGQVDVYLGGDVTTRGTFKYAVKFADISSGSPVYVNQHPDGTHDIVSWTEVIR